MSVLEAAEAELAGMPKGLRDSGLAAGVLAMARELDVQSNSATSKSMCFKAMQDGLRELRALAPPKEEEDALDELQQRRERRSAARGSAAAN